MKKINTLILMVLMMLLTSADLLANKYAVYFTDKNNSPYSTENPLEYLSQRALDRRERMGIALSEQDFPVNPEYVQQLVEMGATVMHTSKWLNFAMISCSSSQISQIEALSFVDRVEYIAPGNFKGESRFKDKLATKTTPYVTDSKEDYLYGAGADQIEQLNGIPVHQQGFTGAGVLVAVVDGGFENANNIAGFDRLYDEGRLVYEQDIVNPGGNIYASNTSDHGTMVLSCMASWLPGQFIGTAPEASYALFRTEDGASEMLIEVYNWVIAAEAADSIGADLITCSLGYSEFDDSSMDYTHAELDGVTAPSSIAATIATEKGIFVSVSAGNSNGTSFPWVSTPSDPVEVCCVGAVNYNGNIAYFSSIGPNGAGDNKPDILARGVSSTVLSTSGSVSSADGTSFACPITSGMIACLLQANPTATPAEVLQIVNSTGNRYPNHDDAYGYGIPDYNDALEQLIAMLDVEFQDITIHDAEGNNDGFLNPGETAVVDVVIYNKSENQVDNIVVEFNALSTSYSLIGETINVGSLAAGESVTLEGAFTITASEELVPTETIKIQGSIVYDGGSVVSQLPIVIYGPNVVYNGVMVANDNNGNGIIEAGETADLLVYIENAGNVGAINMQGTLTSSSEYVTINTDEKYFGSLQQGDIRYASYNVTVSEDYDIKSISLPFELALTGENYNCNLEFSYEDVCNVVFNLVDSYGDGWNGAKLLVSFSDDTPTQNLTIQSGGSATYTMSLATGVEVTLTWSSGTWDRECSFEVLYEGGDVIYTSDELSNGVLYQFVVSCSGSVQEICLPPTNLEAQAAGTQVILTWDAPAEGNPAKYNVYRDGAFIAEVTNTTYTDIDLMTGLYCYAVVAEYADGCLSEYTDEVCVETSSSVISGDANGDGVVDVTDVASVVSYMLEMNVSPFIFGNADVDSNGAIDVLDIINIVNIIFNK